MLVVKRDLEYVTRLFPEASSSALHAGSARYQALSYYCMRPFATLVYEAVSYQCMRPEATSVSLVELLVYEAFSYQCMPPLSYQCMRP
jgi:hypothetical protein